MKKIIVILGLLMAFAGASQANYRAPTIKIDKVEKVTIKHGVSLKMVERHMMKMMRCMLLLKKHDTMRDAMEAKLGYIKEKCEKSVISAKKCKMIKKKMAMGIYNCFTKAEFVREFFKSKAESAEAEAPSAVEPKAEEPKAEAPAVAPPEPASAPAAATEAGA